MPRIPAAFLTFLFVWGAWIFFRATDMSEVKRIFCGFVNCNPCLLERFREGFTLEQALYFAVGLVIIFFLPPANSFSKNFKPAVWNLTVALILLICSVFSFNKISPFIYFNF